MDYWGVMIGLVGTAARDCVTILRKRWWVIVLITILSGATYIAIDRPGTSVLVAGFPGVILVLCGTVWIFADVMRLRWPEYALDGEEFGRLIPLAIGLGIGSALLTIPSLLLKDAGRFALGDAANFVLQALFFTKFAFVFYASEESEGLGDPFGISWRATEGLAFLPTFVIVALSMIPTVALQAILTSTAFPTTAAIAIGAVVQLVVMALFSPWKIRWMGALLAHARAVPLPTPQ